MKWASGVFAIAWMMRMRAVKNRERLRETRADNIEVYKSKIKVFYCYICGYSLLKLRKIVLLLK